MTEYQLVSPADRRVQAWKFEPSERLNKDIPDFIRKAFEDDTIRLLTDGWYVCCAYEARNDGWLCQRKQGDQLVKLVEGEVIMKLDAGLVVADPEWFAANFQAV
jgi:hypothetical protein